MIIIVTKAYNDYNQYGEYFVGVFTTEDKAREAFPKIGRHTPETGPWDIEWYELHKVEQDKAYEWITNSELKENNYV